MSCYSKRCINLVTLIVAIIIFIQTNFLMIKILSISSEKNTSQIEVKLSKLEEDVNKISSTEENLQNEEWQLIIPKINIFAQIKEGVEAETINSHIGHFEDTPYLEGNIGLVAACKGYKENYFENLDKLQENDVIIYKKGDKQIEYKVTTNVVIDEKDWSYLTNTEDNRITLITGIPDNEQQRRCVQAIQIK